MSKGFKAVLIICTILMIGYGVVYFFLANNKNKKEKAPTSDTTETQKITKSVIPEGIQIDAEEITIADETLQYSCNIVNNNKDQAKVNSVKIIIRDKEGNEITQFEAALNTTLEPNGALHISSEASGITQTDIKEFDNIYVFD